MKSKLQVSSMLLLIALVLSFAPAAALPTTASAAQACTDRAQFITDVTVPDGTRYDPGATFTKTWRLRNIGTCTWTSSYSAVFDSGTQMGTTTSVALPNVAPGGTTDVTVNMTAPSAAGHYFGYWKFKNANGVIFGIGVNANKAWWVEINVTGSTTTGVVYNFVTKAEEGKATWQSGAGGLSFPGAEGDAKGFAFKIAQPNFESGAVASQPGLLFSPQQITNGFIQGRFEDFTVQSGDRFQATVGCQAGATSCYVAYRLDYEVGSSVRTFWTFREKFEGLTYSPNLDLTPLAGQTVKFILYVSAWGSPIGDRALWGNPVIVRKGATPVTPPPVTGTPPTATPTNTPGPVTVTVAPSSCDRVQFVSDVTIPDGTIMLPGATFTKTWRLRNVGACAWNSSYQLVYFSGHQMGAASSAPFPLSAGQVIATGQTVDVSINMTAPSAAGSYRGYWMFKNATGILFGIGTQANKPWFVDIKVSGPTVTPGGPTLTPTTAGPTVTPQAGTAYDFATNVCAATWVSRAGSLTCPGTEGDAKGFVLKVSNPKLESGATDARPGLLTFPSPPQGLQDGYIQGFYPPFTVQRGDRFRTIVNCEGGAQLCYVAFRLDYEEGGTIRTFWGPWGERYEGNFYSVDVDLSPLAGRNVKFILTVLSAGVNRGDRALWVGPIIYRAGAAPSTPGTGTATPTNTPVPTTGTTGTATSTPTGAPTGTPTATPTSTPTGAPTGTATPTPTGSTTTYQNTKYNFRFTLPPGSTIVSQSDTTGRVSLPLIAAGTNLISKYLQVHVVAGANPCVSPAVENPTSSENVTINNIPFLKQSGQGAAAGNRYDWTAYSTTSSNACISLAFILHSANPGNYATPPPVFDMPAESAVIGATMATFNKINP